MWFVRVEIVRIILLLLSNVHWEGFGWLMSFSCSLPPSHMWTYINHNHICYLSHTYISSSDSGLVVGLWPPMGEPYGFSIDVDTIQPEVFNGGLSRLVIYCVAMCCAVVSCLVLSYLLWSCLVMSYLVMSCALSCGYVVLSLGSLV